MYTETAPRGWDFDGNTTISFGCTGAQLQHTLTDQRVSLIIYLRMLRERNVADIRSSERKNGYD